MFDKELVRQIITFVGDNPDREGLTQTPVRVIRSWDEIFSGYSKDPKEVFKTFDSDGYDEIILLKDIEFYSMCEHHILPFFGKMHIAYIPKNRVIGISKLARLAEIYTRRLQIQERIGIQIVNDLEKYLKPLGAACIIEAKHLCMIVRGIQKQNSIMVTSALSGVFKTKIEAREELIKLIK